MEFIDAVDFLHSPSRGAVQINADSDTNLTNDTVARTPTIRKILAGTAVASFLGLGLLFLQSMKTRDWAMAILTVVGGLSVIPWASYQASARDCWTGTLSLAVGSLGAIGAVVIYLTLFYFDWFREIFNDKGSGPIGMFLFAALGFGVGGYATLRLLIRLSLPTKTIGDGLVTSCFRETFKEKTR